MDIGQVNWLAVITAVVAFMAIGFLWYGPLFGERWMRERGVTRDELAEGATRAIVVSAVATIVMVVAFALLLTVPDRVDLTTGVVWGVVLAVGFVGASAVTQAAYEGQRPLVTGLFVSYNVVGLAITGAILGAWR